MQRYTLKLELLIVIFDARFGCVLNVFLGTIYFADIPCIDCTRDFFITFDLFNLNEKIVIC